ncbi:hypothetical protein F2Q70_00016683 [Brassica cretica]|uniref:Secreted protein n=1 Tax=Brassica cretica TaxID=69181 RepID=A0A8S9HXJ7_BRACR|nr:hypothetical protein F2Q70_00016683 [Brassica cretica]KAF2601022.1 hypothetical protein F2Q68_00009662 [Brassica cretica]
MAVLLFVPEMIVTLEVVAVSVLWSCRRIKEAYVVFWLSGVTTRVSEAEPQVKSGVDALHRWFIFRIWCGVESVQLQCASSLGVLRVAPSLVSVSRLTIGVLVSSRRARESRDFRLRLDLFTVI